MNDKHLEVLLEGPEEPVFRVVHCDLPKLISMNQWLARSKQGNTDGYAVDTGRTVTVLATHKVRSGKEAEFEAGEVETLNKFKASTGMIGFQLHKWIGLSTLGSGHATVETMLEDLKDSSGSKLRRTAEVWEGYTIPAEYLVMVNGSTCSMPKAICRMSMKNRISSLCTGQRS